MKTIENKATYSSEKEDIISFLEYILEETKKGNDKSLFIVETNEIEISNEIGKDRFITNSCRIQEFQKSYEMKLIFKINQLEKTWITENPNNIHNGDLNIRMYLNNTLDQKPICIFDRNGKFKYPYKEGVKI